ALRYRTTTGMKYNLAMVLLRDQRPAEAIPHFLAALSEHRDANGVRALAFAYWQNGQRDQAIDTLNTWTHEHPDDTLSLQMLQDFRSKAAPLPSRSTP